MSTNGTLLLIFGFCLCYVFAKPNIVLIVTDDQDVIGGLSLMTQTLKLAALGVTFKNAFSTTPVCCPARSSLLTGLYQHNHGVFNNSQPGGCNGARWQEELEGTSLGPILQAAGYRTFYGGKYLNAYSAARVPPGWDWWAGLKGNSVYYNYTLNVNGTNRDFGDSLEDYLTDVLADWALDFLRINDTKPFFLVVAPPSAHAPFTPSPKYEGLWKGAHALRTANFNTGRDGKHWLVRTGSPLPASAVRMVDETFANRLETLMSVDDMVAAVANIVPQDTFFIYTSDHGFHLGQFSQAWDKRQPYEADIRIPLIVWGPGIAAGASLPHPLLNLDIAPTLYEIAGVAAPPAMDGVSFLSLLHSAPAKWDRSFTVEYHGEGGGGGSCFDDKNINLCNLDLACNCFDSRNNTYTCVRHLSLKKNTLSCEFDDDESFKEFYDLNTDPSQLNNLLA